MKKIQVIDILRKIKNTKVTFFSIIFIVSLGVSTYLGINFAQKSMTETGDDYFREQKFHDIELNYAYGFTDDDLKEIQNISDIDVAEGGYSTTGFLAVDDESRLITVQSFTSDIDKSTVVEGRLPEKSNEIAIEILMRDEDNIKLGDELVIDCTDEDGTDKLIEKNFEVVGVVEHPSYTCNYVYSRRGRSTKGNGNCLNYVLVSKDAFDMEQMDNCYSNVYIWSDSLTKYNSFSEEYENKCEDTKEKIKTISRQRSNLRYNNILETKQTQINNAQEQLNTKLYELKNAENQISDAESQIQNIQQQIDSYPESAENALLRESLQTQLNSASEDLATKKSEYETAKTEYQTAQNELETAKNNLNSLTDMDWTILDRDDNVSYAMYKDNAEGLGKLSLSFAFVYIVVALMVCYSSIGRMIGEHRYLIGTQKALGYRKGEILRQYLVYTFICTVWGCINGAFMAIYLIEDMSLESYRQIYFFADYLRVYSMPLLILVTCSAILFASLATIFACRKLVREPAVSLLTYKLYDDNKNKIIYKNKFWENLPLFGRTIIKDVFNDKKHFLSTVIGVAGCTALMIIGFTLKFAIQGVNTEQFSNIQRFDACLQISKDSNAQQFSQYLDENSRVDYIQLSDMMMGIQVNNKDIIMADILCFDSENVSSYFALEDYKNGKEITADDEGILISSNTASYYKIKKNDYINIIKDDGTYVPVRVSGIVTNYVCHFIVISHEYYQEIMGEAAKNNEFFINLNGVSKDEIDKDLKNIDGYIMLSGKEMGMSIFKNISDSIDSVIKILIFLSAIMALIVVFNLSIMYINEKSKILTIMRINGFTLKETKRFIAYGDMFLTILGLIFGVVGGIALGYTIVRILETDSVCYVHAPSLKACVISCIICTFYIVVVNKIARSRIKRLPLNNVNAND